LARIRINKALSLAGAGSRRKAEQLVLDGRVAVNGDTVRSLSQTLDPERDELSLDGRVLKLPGNSYYLFYKPRGIVSTMHDDRGRACVGDMIKGIPGSLKPVGRLDRRSEGLMVLTNDGALANVLSHPRHGIRKEYQVTVRPVIKDNDAKAMVAGVELDDGPVRFLQLDLLSQDKTASRLKVVVDEGRYRMIRRVFEAAGYEVRLLKRTTMGPFKLGQLKPGETKELPGKAVSDAKRQLGLDQVRR